MRIFINDIPVKITDKPILNQTFNTVINKNATEFSVKELLGNVLITTTYIAAVDRLLKIMTDKKYKNIHHIVIQVHDKDKSIEYLKSKFNIVEAAGGIVEKNNRLLWIFRRGVWDLPKGKLDPGEKRKTAAIREVEEETAVKVALKEKICATWHTYIRNKKFVLKRTHWYAMDCLDDSKMTPQIDEDIERVEWLNEQNSNMASNETFASISWVIQKYYQSKINAGS